MPGAFRHADGRLHSGKTSFPRLSPASTASCPWPTLLQRTTPSRTDNPPLPREPGRQRVAVVLKRDLIPRRQPVPLEPADLSNIAAGGGLAARHARHVVEVQSRLPWL